jgi:rubredoxin
MAVDDEVAGRMVRFRSWWCDCSGTMLAEQRRRLMKTYMCVICGFVYDEAQGIPEEGIAPGTRWEDVPLNWRCPECGAGKDDFELVEV